FLPNPAFFPGPTHTEAYILLSSNVVNFASDLPLIVIHTLASASIPSGAPTPDASVIFAAFNTRAGRASLTDQPQLVKRAGINIRGSSTQGYPKSSWAVELWDEFNQD